MGTKTEPQKVSRTKVILELEKLKGELVESGKRNPGDFSNIDTFMRGLTGLSSGLVAGNKGLSAASQEEVLLSYDIGGLNPKARIGAYVSIEPSALFGIFQARTALDEAAAKVRGRGIFALLRGSIATDVIECGPKMLQIRIMDACDMDEKGTSYLTVPGRVARRARLAASVRDEFIAAAKSSGSKIIGDEDSPLD